MNEFKIKNGLVVSGSADIEQNLTVRGTLTADQYNVSIVSTSILYESGSTKFGDSLDDLHEFTGSVAITGSITLNGQAIGTGKLDETTFNSFTSSYTTGAFTGSFKGDGSQLTNVPSSGVTGLELYKIVSGSVSASISPNRGLEINTKTTITGSITLALTEDPDPTGLTTQATHLYVSASNNQTGEDLYIRQQDNKVKWKWFEGKLNSGILWGGALSYSGTTIYITKGSGIVIDQRASATNEISPITHYVNWNDITASCQNVTSSLATYVGIDISGSLYQQDNYFSVNQYRETIPLGMFNHTNRSSITSYANDVLTAYDDVNQTANFIQAFGPMKLEGLTLSPQSGNLQLTIGSGQSYIYGGFYQQDPNNSSHKITSPVVTPQIARVRRNGSGSFTVDNNNGAFYSTIDPGNWDDGTGTLNSLSGGAYAIQRVFFNPFTNRVHVYYGQSFYGTKTAAFQSLASDPFSEAPYSAHQYVLVGYIIHKGGTNDLSNTSENQIIQAGLFRNTVGSGGGAGTFASLHDLDDVDILNPNNGDLIRYNSSTNLWEHSKSLTGDYSITGSLNVSGGTTGSFTGSFKGDATNLYNIPASGVTGLQLNKIITGSASASIDDTGLYVNRDLYVDGIITAKEFHTDYVTSSVLFQSGSTKFGDTFLDTHQFTGSVLINGHVNANSLTGSINFNNLTDVPTLVSGSSQILNGTNIVSGSDQLTGSYDARYVLSGSITQTTWDNIANKPSGIVSASQQIVNLGFLETSSFNTMSSSINTRVETLELSDYNQDGKISSLTNKTGSYATTGSNAFVGNENINGNLSVTGSVVISGSIDITNANVGNSRFLFTQVSGSTTWNIVHNLGYSYPNVTVYDGSNNKVMIPADVISVDPNTTQVTFATPEYGYALVSMGGLSTTTSDAIIYSLQTSTSSLNTFTSSAITRLNSIEGVSGSYATTGSNLFKGAQTISGSIIPAVTNTYDLGSETNQFRHLYLSSASLYIDGTKVLGSTSQELQITTDTGQAFKILEDGSDNITLQSADGNIELKSSGGGDVILDPTTGVIALKGTTTLYAGNKILSSDGNAIQIGNSTTITGSLIVTGFIETQELRTTYISSSILYRSGSTKFGDELNDTHSFTGSLSVSGSISVPGSGLISGSAQVDVMSTTNIVRLATTGSNSFTGNQTLSNGIFLKGIRNSGALAINLLGIESGSDRTLMTATGDFVIQNGSLNPSFTLTTSGVGTFSSTLSANGKMFLQRASTGADTLLQFKNEVGVDKAYIKFGGVNEEISFHSGTGSNRNLIIDADGSMGFNTSTTGVRSYLFKALSGRQLAIEALESGGVHSIYLRPSSSGRNLITSNYFSGGVYLPLALSGRENDVDLVLHANGNISMGSASDGGVKLAITGANSAEGQLYVGNTDVTYSAGVNFTTAGTNRGFVGWRHTNSGAPFSLTGIHLFNTDNSNIVFGTNNTVKAVINVDGNLGINDTNPGTRLSVNGANYVEMATFACTTAAAAAIVSANAGYVQFSSGNARHCSNTSLFVPVTDGIQITKAGIVYVSFSQDITTAGTTGYVAGYIQKNKSTISENLITNTGGQWDGINGCVTINVAANDVINFSYNAAEITSFDPNTWSQYSFVWTSR